MTDYSDFINEQQYDALSGKITFTKAGDESIALQIRFQSDWAETDETKSTFIVDKPTVYKVMDEGDLPTITPVNDDIAIFDNGESYIYAASSETWDVLTRPLPLEPCTYSMPFWTTGPYGKDSLVALNGVYYASNKQTDQKPPHADWDTKTIDDFFMDSGCVSPLEA